MTDQHLPGPQLIASTLRSPVLLSVPHAGRTYPSWLLAMARSGLSSLELLEDPRVDELVQPALARGLGAVIARAPRAAIDCNRDEGELDPRVIDGIEGLVPGSRASVGLGLVPSRTSRDGMLWTRSLSLAELEQRLEQVHRPYHRAIADGLSSIEQRFGAALLLDCHSMPPRRPGEAQIVLGDRHGTSAAGWITTSAAQIARSLGFKVSVNAPFAGGHIVAAHGRPARGVHALQLEIDRSLYCRADGRTPGPGFERVAVLIDRLAARLGDALAGFDAEAAE